MSDHTQILGIENKCASLILIDRHIFSRSRLLYYRILPAARMRTRSLIGISPGKIIAQKAPSRIGNTHRSMDKAFNLHLFRNIIPDLPNLLKGKLPCSNHTLCTLLPPELISRVIGIIRLRTDVALNLRTDFLCHLKNTRICNDQSIRFQSLKLFQVLTDSHKIPVMRQNIHRHIYLHSMVMCKRNSLLHILMGKILRLCPESKSLSADVYRIRAKNNRCFQYFQAASWN